ncbi:MAG: penicillin-binding transpeptidase domain-containing protein, partial [Oscillospiraceae bacterium]|nr:penicillin-binding transpeptidase domain-containing protein [Oscillospiraceae bacterium]
VPAQMGSFGVLTLDSHLQKTLEDSLRNNIIGMRSKKDAGGANAGGAVVLDVNTGEILAMASYPSFNLETFNQDYKALSTSANKPLFNRAIGGAYAPGSTLKMLTALAGLEENAITPRETIQDKGKFTKYNDYQPACWLWNQSSASHGYINVVEALKVSCNYFFYELGERLGIEKLNKYGRALGLGQATGIEIGGESSGIMAGPEYRKRQGTIWVPGDTLQSAIGQGDNLLTPLQLASYIATIASGGTRYKPHLVKSIKSYDVNKSGGEVAPVVLDSIDMKKENYDTIMQGMRDVSEAGTASSVFANYKVAVGSKTGTATISKSEVNAVFVAVAPLDKPEIAIAVVVEKGGHGSYAAPIAKDVLDAYFDTSSVVAPMNKIGSLLQ